MGLIPFGVIWAGYLVVWYGRTLTIGPGLGIFDLVAPSRVAKVDSWLKANAGSQSGPQTGPDPGTRAVNGNQIGTTDAPPGQSGPQVPKPPSGHYPSTPPSRAG